MYRSTCPLQNELYDTLHTWVSVGISIALPTLATTLARPQTYAYELHIQQRIELGERELRESLVPNSVRECLSFGTVNWWGIPIDAMLVDCSIMSGTLVAKRYLRLDLPVPNIAAVTLFAFHHRRVNKRARSVSQCASS